VKGNSHVLVGLISRNLIEMTKENYEKFRLVEGTAEIQNVASRQKSGQAMYV
jgi:hypothetical protein